jgi:putative SOS response-associated peptidase YedK
VPGKLPSPIREFEKSNRCFIPVSVFFEFTGKKYPKAKPRFTLHGAPFIALAAGSPGAGQPGAFTMPTSAPDRIVEPYYCRHIVVLCPEDSRPRFT